MKILVTGGCGFIGSHTVVELLKRGHDVHLVDNFCNSSPKVLDHLQTIAGVRPDCTRADVRDFNAISMLLPKLQCDAVFHFAALKSVGESWRHPADYFDNNISGTISLLKAMRNNGVSRLVFSSSATVYGHAGPTAITEEAPLGTTNPYARSKRVMEELIEDLGHAHSDFRAGVLRYFNPVGAHPSGELGEAPLGVPSNLMPYVSQVACGLRPHLNVFGNDYDTPDGTGIRDYIHIMDLARAHADALETLNNTPRFTVNLGTGRGYSVLELVRTFEQASGRHIPIRFGPRREGDVAVCFADPSLAKTLLGWRAELDLARMCTDAWRWQTRHPQGYAEPRQGA